MFDIRNDLIEGDIIQRINGDNGVYHEKDEYYVFSHYSDRDKEVISTKEFPSAGMFVWNAKFINRPSKVLVSLDDSLFEVD